METLDCVIIGAGVIGLATGRRLAQQGRSVFVLEQHSRFGDETSSRNSGVIHAGIYYPRDFLKTRLCISGRQQLYRYCEQHNIPHQKIGKLIVASDEHGRQKLQQIEQHALSAGVTSLQWLDQQQLHEREPALNASHALLSPQTGIIDQQAYMLQLAADIEHADGQIVCQQQITSACIDNDGFELTLNHSDTIRCRTLINCAGLGAQQISELLDVEAPPLHIAKGNYFSYQGRSPFQHLIYPTPEANNAGLGIHATLDLEQRLRFGPDVEHIDSVDYQVNENRKADFINAIQRYWPDIDSNRLQPDYAGCRPKLQAKGAGAEDFMIQTATHHGIKQLIQCFGIESPGLTASLAIADYISEQLHV